MRRLANDLHQLDGFPPNAFNVYLVGDVLVDAGTRHSAARILRQVRGWPLAAHVLTHAHPDHQGSSHRICEERAVPLWCGEADAPAMEDGQLARRQPDHLANRLGERIWAGPPRPVDRRLREGDEVAGFVVIDTPGHSAGHIALWRESDRALVLGDVLNNVNVVTGRTGLHEPPGVFTPDPARNRESARRLAALAPSLVCFGHGPPLRNPHALREFVRGLG